MSNAQSILKPLSTNQLKFPDVKWQNNSNEVIKLSWIDLKGDENHFADIAPGIETAYGLAYFVGVNVVRDLSGNVILVYIINGQPEETVVISQAAVDHASVNGIKGCYPALRSLPDVRRVANVEMENNSSKVVDAYYIGTNGTRLHMAHLEPGQKQNVSAYFGAYFTFMSEGNDRLVYVTSDAVGQKMIINDELINFWN